MVERDEREAVGDAGGSLLELARGVAADARALTNHYVIPGLVATSGLGALLLHRLLPEQHPILPDHRTLWRLVKLQSYALARVCGIRVTVRGRERVAGGGPFVFIANHQSYLDFAVLAAFLPGANRLAMTEELTEHAFWGPLLRGLGIGAMSSGECEEAALEALRRMAEAGASTVVFPEGRRGRGLRLLPFARVPFAAVLDLGLPVVPVAIRGTRSIMAPGGVGDVRAGSGETGGAGGGVVDVEVIVQEPIPTAHLLPQDSEPLREDVRASIARYVEEIDPLLDEAAAESEDDDIGAWPIAEPGRA